MYFNVNINILGINELKKKLVDIIAKIAYSFLYTRDA